METVISSEEIKRDSKNLLYELSSKFEDFLKIHEEANSDPFHFKSFKKHLDAGRI